MYLKSDLWHYLQNTAKTVVMYGMGNGADKILKVCEKYSITVSDFFASDGFVRGHSFHGKTVLSYSDVKKKYGKENIIVLLSFASSLPSVIELITRVANECELYAPDVPVCGDTLFCTEFLSANIDKIQKARQLLADDLSVNVFDDVINYKLSGDISYLFRNECDENEEYSLLDAKNVHTYADLGAYNGDTVRKINEFSSSLQEVYAFEPDRKNFAKLQKYCQTLSGIHFNLYQAAAWKENTVLEFSTEGSRNSGLFSNSGKTETIQALSLDNQLQGKPVDHIKYDVEGAEFEAILGSQKCIKSFSPKLLISAYHRSEDIFALPLMIADINPDYKLFYRRTRYIPAWDLNLLCI